VPLSALAEGGIFLYPPKSLDLSGFAGRFVNPKTYTPHVDNPVDIVDKYMDSYPYFCG
jgi:hypothetical protein